MTNNKIITGAIITAVAAAITSIVFIRQSRKRVAMEAGNEEWGHNLEETLRVHPKRHITSIFSKAKNAMKGNSNMS